MKVKVYPNHNRVIAVGHEFGKRIKVISVCQDGDTFDEAFGKKLSELKYKVAKKEAQIADHKRYIKILRDCIAECEHEIASQEAAIEIVTKNRDTAVDEMNNFISTKYAHHEG